MFDFFKKKPPEEPVPDPDEEQLLIDGAAVTFFVEDGEPKVDISITDYEDSSIQGIAIILSGLLGCTFFNATMDMVKDGFLEEDKPEHLQKIIAMLETLDLFQKHSDCRRFCGCHYYGRECSRSLCAFEIRVLGFRCNRNRGVSRLLSP